MIATDVFQVGGSGLTASEDAAIYLIRADGDAVLIDSGCGRSIDRLLTNVEGCGVDPKTVSRLLITHCHYDHTGGAGALRERLDCKVAIHEAEADYLERGDAQVTASTWYGASPAPCPVDERLVGADGSIDVGGRTLGWIHIPGHSPGSVAFVWESDGKTILFGQDVHGPLHPSLLSNRDDYLASLQRLLEVEADVLCEGHYGIFESRTETAAFIRSFMR